MKLKSLLMVLAMSLAMVLGSCSAAPTKEPVQGVSADTSAVSSAETSEEAETLEENAPPEESAQQQEAPQEAALAAYQEILRAAPAVEGEPEEWYDASFGYEENREQFGEHYDLFGLVDVDQDGIPELFALSTVNFRWTPVSVFAYSDGNAVLVKDPLDTEAHGTFEQRSTANGGYNTYFCEAGHIHSQWRGADPMGEGLEEDQAYLLEGTTLTPVECEVGESDQALYLYDMLMANTTENVDSMTLK